MTSGGEQASVFERGEHFHNLLTLGLSSVLSRFSSRDLCARIQRVGELNGHILPPRLQSVDSTPNVNRTVDKAPRGLQLPSLTSKIGKFVKEIDRSRR